MCSVVRPPSDPGRCGLKVGGIVPLLASERSKRDTIIPVLPSVLSK